ncbi:hypothetical protein AMS68_005857 [Peltaster fructicola]|uniref:Sin1 middle CRIM domain-containing protein n=1 Tax=Peltaster fructicola TaxID=286661 RepID=A0A6H0Y115_9PEZI|nr:hypothetical protein AMS68_005857 [Peltaster fructicola]
MSLLSNEDFTLYNLRLGYLQTINDGVGERLITLNAAVLSDPAFKAAGFTPDHAAIKRCYSPPIPTTGAAEYFTRPARSRQGYTLNDGETPDEEGGGMITGRASEDTLGPVAISEKRRRRQKEHMVDEEDDSSDLSDDSDDEESAAHGVRFAKVKERKDSSLSPPKLDRPRSGPEVHIISPSFRPRTSSLGTHDIIQGRRPRGDTITSSEFSSESEMLDVSTAFKRKLPSRPQRTAMLASKIAEEETEDSDLEDDEEEEEVAEASDLSDEFEGDDVAVPSPGFLNAAGGMTSSPDHSDDPMATSATIALEEPAPVLEDLAGLPSGRPRSVPMSSLLSKALKGDTAVEGGKSFQKYAELSGKGEVSPLWIRIYYPFADGKALEVPIRRQTADDRAPNVFDLIGLALYRYEEDECEPRLKGSELKVAQWELRMVDDGEVEMDFPALNATRPITDFTSNNNRPPQRRARDKPWDEFGLVRASAAVDEPEPAVERREPVKAQPLRPAAPPVQPSMVSLRNPITGPSFTLARSAGRKDSSNLLDAPAAPTMTSTPRTGLHKDVTIHFTDPQSFHVQHIEIDATADTYIAEVFDVACTRLRLDKALYVLKVRGTQTVAPPDRTVEALGANLHLDIARRRFGAVGDFGLGTSGSPGSTSPNAPLELVPNTPPIGKDARRRKGVNMLVTTQGKGYQTMTTSSLIGVQHGRRYNVLRKQPLSFAASHPRTLIIAPDLLQVLPAQNVEDAPVSGKVTNIHMSSIVGVKVSRKHPKMVRVVVYKEKEAKRYDFECASNDEAQSIVADIRVGVGQYGSGVHDSP